MAKFLPIMLNQLDGLIDGKHPLTGKPIDTKSAFNDELIIAWLKVLRKGIVEHETVAPNARILTAFQRKNLAKGRPINHGTKWTKAEIDEIVRDFKGGADLLLMQTQFGRAYSAILNKLEERGILEVEESKKLYWDTRRRENAQKSG